MRDVAVSTRLLNELLNRNEERPTLLRWVTSDMPADAWIVSVYLDWKRADVFVARVSSEQFDDVPSGHVVPSWEPRYVEHTEPLPALVPA